MELKDHAQYQVATKVLLFHGDKILTLETPDGYMDFPGGRVNKSEIDLSWQEALRREVDEELGRDVSYSIGDYAFVSKRMYYQDGERHNIAAIYFTAKYTGGKITLSEEHGAYEWLTPVEILDSERKCISSYEQTELEIFLQKHRV